MRDEEFKNERMIRILERKIKRGELEIEKNEKK